MSASIPVQILTKTGRTLYKDARGRFISRARFDFLNRRDPATGRFLSKAAAARRGTLQEQEARLRRILGKPPKGWQWVQIANKYSDRFKDYL